MELFTEEKLKELSKFVSSFKQIKHAAAEWNRIKTDRYYTTKQMITAINNARNDTAMILNRYFNRLMCMPDREWTNPETLMFYIFVDWVVMKHESAELALTDFTLYSGRSVSKVAIKAFEYPPLQTQLKGTTQHRLITTLTSFVKDRNFNEAISYVDRVYDLNDDKIRECLIRQDSLFIPEVDGRNKPIIPKIEFGNQKGPFTAEDLMKKFNGDRVKSDSPPFKPKPNVVPIERTEPKEVKETPVTTTSNPFHTTSSPPPTAQVIPKMDDFEYDVRELIKTRKDEDRNQFLTMEKSHPIFSLISGLIQPMVEDESVVEQILAHKASIQTFIQENSCKVCKNKAKNDLQFNSIRLFLIIAMRAGITCRPLSKFLHVGEKWLKVYIDRQRKRFSDFIRHVLPDYEVTSIEMEFLYGYIKEVHESDELSIIDSIYVSVRIFDLSIKHVVPELVQRGYLKSSTLGGVELEQELSRVLRYRTKKFLAEGYVEHDIIDVAFAEHFAIADQFIPEVDTSQFRSLVACNMTYQIIEPAPLPLDVVEPVEEVEEPATNLSMQDSQGWKRRFIEEFMRHRCCTPPNKPQKELDKLLISFEDMYSVFCKYCTEKNIEPFTFSDFNKFMVIKGARQTIDDFENYFWVGYAFLDPTLVKSDYAVKYEHMCKTLDMMFPNANIKQLMPIAAALLNINDQTIINSVKMSDDGLVLTFDKLTIPNNKIVHLTELKQQQQ